MLGASCSVLEPQPERLRQHLRHPQEVQREQQPLFLQRLEPMMPARRDHELHTRPVPLPSPPGEPSYRFRGEHRHPSQITNRPDHLVPGKPPRRCPTSGPGFSQRQQIPCRLLDPVRNDEIVQPARIGPHDGPCPRTHDDKQTTVASPRSVDLRTRSQATRSDRVRSVTRQLFSGQPPTIAGRRNSPHPVEQGEVSGLCPQGDRPKLLEVAVIRDDRPVEETSMPYLIPPRTPLTPEQVE